jgi:hypothetical protein
VLPHLCHVSSDKWVRCQERCQLVLNLGFARIAIFFCKTGMIWYILSTNVVVLCYSILVPLQAVEPDVADLLCSRRRLTLYADGGGRDCLIRSRPSSSAALGGRAPLQSEEAGAPVCLGSTSGGGASPSAREWTATERMERNMRELRHAGEDGGKCGS